MTESLGRIEVKALHGKKWPDLGCVGFPLARSQYLSFALLRDCCVKGGLPYIVVDGSVSSTRSSYVFSG